MADLDVIHTSNRFLRTIDPARVPRVILSKVELEQTRTNHRHILLPITFTHQMK